MSVATFCESTVEEAALEWFAGIGYRVLHGPEIAPGGEAAERATFADVVLEGRLREALARLNPGLPAEAREDALRRVLRRESQSLVAENRAFHRRLVDGVTVEVRGADGRVRGVLARLVDFERPEQNDWVVVNQFTVHEGEHHRRPDIVVFVNGLPLAVIELKDPTSEDATVFSAFKQIETYKAELPALFAYNAVVAISNGFETLLGTITSPWERFGVWRTRAGKEPEPALVPPLQVLIEGAFEPGRLLRLLRHFITFESDGEAVDKKLAQYHQFNAVNEAVERTVAAAESGDRRAGVVWHTQGSGKSLSMVFYAGRMVLHPALANPTIVVLTDRNDLDDQLYGTFARCSDVLRQTPVQAESREDLRARLHTAAGGIVFTTVQKFAPPEKGGRFPLLSERRNIIVIADEAHRSQYDFVDGFARNIRDGLPNATFIGFTGTPIDLQDRVTRGVFGEYIDIYDIRRAVEDHATVPIYYESRLAKLQLNEDEKPRLDAEFEELTEGEEASDRELLRTKWAALEAVAGTEKRLELVAADIARHYEARCEALAGKAMIVCMSRRICVALYEALARVRPAWASAEDGAGSMKVVMTGSAADGPAWQQHIRNKQARDGLAHRFKDAADPLKLVIVRDMWLTGFDAPAMHTMYIDKPMRGHGLMQAIARVNRVFRDKPSGLVVDYLGIAEQLRAAMATYTQSGGAGRATIDQAEAVAVFEEKLDIVVAFFHGFAWEEFWELGAVEQLQRLLAALEHVLGQENGKERYLQAVADLKRAFQLAMPHEDVLARADELRFFDKVRGSLAGQRGAGRRSPEDLDRAIQQLISRAIMTDEVIDVFALAGLERPDISILSDAFLAQMRALPQKNLAVEMLQRLLNDEVKRRSARNVVQGRSFAEALANAVNRYRNRSIEAAQVIAELIALAQEMRAAEARGEKLGLREDEVAFYDALVTNASAVAVLGDAQLAAIAREITAIVRQSATTDWSLFEQRRANLRRLVRRTLRKHGYPPDEVPAAVVTVVQQAELYAERRAA